MHPSLPRLIELQKLDLRIAELAAALAALPKRGAQAEAAVAAVRAELAKATEAQKANVKERKKLELDVEAWKEKAKKYRGQSSEVKSNEAYKALLHEIELAEGETRKAEDKLLEHMVAGEEFDRRVKAGQKEVAAAEAAGKEEQARIAAEKARLEAESAKLKAEREIAAAEVSEDLLARYSKLAKRYYGLALARMVDEACTGCRVHLRPHVVQRVRQAESEEIVECESCSRILYFIEEAPAAGTAAAPTVETPAAQGGAE